MSMCKPKFIVVASTSIQVVGREGRKAGTVLRAEEQREAKARRQRRKKPLGTCCSCALTCIGWNLQCRNDAKQTFVIVFGFFFWVSVVCVWIYHLFFLKIVQVRLATFVCRLFVCERLGWVRVPAAELRLHIRHTRRHRPPNLPPVGELAPVVFKAQLRYCVKSLPVHSNPGTSSSCT